MAEIVLVRHGETEWSRDGRHTGASDIPLTETGRRQAELLAEPLRAWTFERVLTSPLSRASETCRLAGLAERAEERADLIEWDYGDYEGITTPQIREARPGWFLWRDGCPDGEAAGDVGRRLDPIVAELRDTGGHVALIAHGHVLRVLAARWLGMTAEAGAHFALSTGTLSVLGYEREVPAIRCWNAPVG